MTRRSISLVALFTVALLPSTASAQSRNFDAGSLIIPMDLSYQNSGQFQAFGLVFQLLRQGFIGVDRKIG